MRNLRSWIERNLTMTQEALAQGRALQAPLGGHTTLEAARDNDGPLCQIDTSAWGHSLSDARSAWLPVSNRTKADCLNAIFGAVLGGVANGPTFNFWTGILDDGHSSQADVNPGLTNTAEAQAMQRPNIWAVDLQADGMPGFHDVASTDAGDLAALADWSSIQAQANYHAGNDIFMI
jgi:hypothetical protein